MSISVLITYETKMYLSSTLTEYRNHFHEKKNILSNFSEISGGGDNFLVYASDCIYMK